MTIESSSSNSITTLSDQFVEAIEQAGQSIVAVNADRRCGASGIHWQSGIIVTVDQAIRREEEIPITLADGQTLSATLVGRDSTTDLAVLRLSELNLPTLDVSSPALKVGQIVLAAARSSEGSLSASMGIIGRLGGSWRSWQGGQIDQLIRPVLISAWGLAGSVLLDSQGQAIGINTTGPRHMTITIPNQTIQRVIDQLLQTGRIARGYLGVGMQAVPIPDRLVETLGLPSDTGVMILSVAADSPADQAGFLIGDVLIALDAQPISDVSDVRLMLTSEQVGQSLTASVVRGGVRTELAVTVGEYSGEFSAEGGRGGSGRGGSGRGGSGRGRGGRGGRGRNR